MIAFSVALVAVERGWLDCGRHVLAPAAVFAGLLVLGVASLTGVSTLPALTISGLIVFTACYFALIARHEGRWLRVCLTFAFGLVHGFGFAGILMEMTLPADRLVPALVGFNLGVELGQIGVVVLLLPTLATLRRLVSAQHARLGTQLAAAGLCGLGVFWLVERAF